MEFRQLELFLAVVDHGGLVRAASALHVSQPTVTQTIRALERELRTPLFHRVGRGLVLTPAGGAMVVPARRLLRNVSTARAAVTTISGVHTSRLDLAATGGPLESLIPVFGAFRRRHSTVEVRIITPDSEEGVVRSVAEGRSELGFLPLADPGEFTDIEEHRDLEFIPLGVDEIHLVLPPGCGTDLPDPVSLMQLPDLPVVGVPAGALGRRLVEAALREAGVRTRLAMVTAHRYTQSALVARGIGMAFVPVSQAELARRSGAVTRQLAPELRIPYGAVHHAGYLSPAARELITMVTGHAEDRSR